MGLSEKPSDGQFDVHDDGLNDGQRTQFNGLSTLVNTTLHYREFRTDWPLKTSSCNIFIRVEKLPAIWLCKNFIHWSKFCELYAQILKFLKIYRFLFNLIRLFNSPQNGCWLRFRHCNTLISESYRPTCLWTVIMPLTTVPRQGHCYNINSVWKW